MWPNGLHGKPGQRHPTASKRVVLSSWEGAGGGSPNDILALVVLSDRHYEIRFNSESVLLDRRTSL